MRSDMKSNELINNCDIKKPLLTIAIPTFQRFNLLKETLQSVFALSFKIPIEIIIVDNDPDNEELALIEMLEFEGNKFKYYKNEENYGMFDNWNQCINLAQGGLVTILNDDDLLNDNFSNELEKILDLYEKTSDIPLIGFSYEVLDQRDTSAIVKKPFLYRLQKIIKKKYNSFLMKEKKNITQPLVKEITMAELFRGNLFAGTLAVIFDRNRAIKLGGFNPIMYPSADYDFWLRWINNDKIVISPNVVAKYRIRQNESMKPTVLKGFIDVNYNLRRRYTQSFNKCKFMSVYLYVLRKYETYIFYTTWGSNESYRYNNFIFMKIILLRALSKILFKITNYYS